MLELAVRVRPPLGGEVFLELRLQRVQVRLALGLLRDDGVRQPPAGEGVHALPHLVRVELARLEVRRGDAGLLDEPALHLHDLGDVPLRHLQALGHDLLGGRRATLLLDPLPRALGRLALDHQDVDAALVIDPSRHDHVERGEIQLLVGRVHLPLPADQPDPDRTDGPVER